MKPGLTQQIDRDAASWTRDLVDVDAFQNEQMRLRQVWTLVGLTTELRHDGDWISRDLWGHSVFVQRFGDQLKGFENRCAHRFFPLRHGERGNGPIRCGFHGWQYDKEGVAIGIPMCKEFFGCTPPYLPLASRADVLVFQTAPLAAPVQVAGPIEIDLWVATDGPDTDFTAKLIDVHPPSADYPRGYAMILTDGVLRLRYAEDPAHPRLRTQGEITRIRITLFPTANLFLPGHRIRLDVSSSNFPKLDVNPNTGEPEGLARRRRIAVNTVFMDAARPSRVTLPLLAV